MLLNRDYFCNRIAWVDFVVAENMQAIQLLDSSILQEFHNLEKHQKRIWDLPEMKAYH
jgi:hypothetical protein